ncbi:hypothetical protein SOV_45640 [Sporomusa ovata DSM 2662]|uniref:hypothetical protein n=1 Tax=Sporomusa ovata TaxID=2378 RepID=UPI0003885AE8|nr:hypothetical protein [Sporomusa ovata]EQB26952.1 hypothetical protein SOV_3c08260 [Sporomusa ovata DSM 2662]
MHQGWTESEENVGSFLRKVKDLLNDPNNLSIVQKTGIKDKTREFREKYGINHQMVCEELLRLDSSNYSYTDNDHKEIGGEFQIFGQFILPPIVDKPIEVYIKLKIRGRVVCMSFHEAEFPLNYPYN